MTLTQPIAPVLVSDPVAAYQEFVGKLQPGEKYKQEFDYSCIEVSAANIPKRLEESFPNSTVLGIDGDVTSNEPGQGSLGCCGSVATIAALASVPSSFAHSLENCIYPKEVSSHGLYFIRVADPDNFLGTKWVAIDSNVSTVEGGKSEFMRLKDGEALAPALFLKAAATMRGGTYDGISNSDPFKKSFSWYPSTTVKTSTFAEFADAILNGGVYVFSMTQQYDTAGVAINPLGVVYGHAFSAPETLTAINGDGTIANLVRVSNPWGGGSDYQSEYSEGAPFWADHPELADKLAVVSRAGGEYWVSWNQFKTLVGKTVFEVTVPLPLAIRPHIDYFRYEFDGTPVMSSEWWNWNAELVANVPLNRVKTLTLTEPTTLTLDIFWLNGSGPRHTNLKFLPVGSSTVAAQLNPEIWWGGNGQQQVTLKAGSYRIYPLTRSPNTDRGTLQVLVSSDKPFKLEASS